MGCEFGKPQVVTASPEEPEVEMTGFNDAQIDSIRSTWPLLSGEDRERVGAEIFIRIFRESPSVHDLFHHFQINKLEDLYHSKMFSDHAQRFMGIIQHLVDNLECPENVDQELLILGAKHATFDGYHPEYFRLYTKCMLEVWEMELGEEFILDVRESWKHAFEYVVEHMTEGFDMCLGGQLQDIIDDSTSANSSVKELIISASGSPRKESTSFHPSANVKEIGSSHPRSPVKQSAENGGTGAVRHLSLVEDDLIRVQ